MTTDRWGLYGPCAALTSLKDFVIMKEPIKLQDYWDYYLGCCYEVSTDQTGILGDSEIQLSLA